jgi:prophage regulatory protein
MNRTEAIQLLEEALCRIKQPQPNHNGGDTQIGGAYWRLMKVTHDFLIPQLAAQEGPEHAARLISMHQPTPAPAPQKAEKMLRLPDVELATGCKKSTIYKMMKENRFPKCVRVTARMAMWPESQVQHWINTQVNR